MASRQRKESSRYPILKYIQSPLAQIQYNSFTEILCNQRAQEGRNNSFLFPSTLQHFHMINHLSNTTKHLEVEIDQVLKNAQNQGARIKQRISLLLAIQQEKLNHARAALQELRWQRNALGMRLLLSEGGAVQQKTVSSWLFTAADEEYNDIPFDTQDLLLNIRFAAASGVAGNSSRAPVDDDLLQQMAAAFQQQVPGVSNSLLVTGADFLQYQRINQSIEEMLNTGEPLPLPEIEYDQIETVLAAFSQIASEINDPMQRFVPFRPRTCEGCDRRQLVQDLVHQLEIAAKRAQEILEKSGEHGRTTYVGEFLQYATFPCFQEVYNDSSDASMVSSTSMLRDADANKEEEIFGNLEQSDQPNEILDYPRRDEYCFCGNRQQDELIQCESGDTCPFARDGWFHPRCLFLKAELVGDHFYCPGCYVRNGGDFKSYGDEWKMGKRKVQEVRR